MQMRDEAHLRRKIRGDIMQEIEGQAWGLLLWSLIVIGAPIAVFRFLVTRGRRHPVPVPVQDDSALRLALGTRRCDLCKRNCELIAPKCRRGRELRDAIISGRA
jgi:hypothetical protein